METQHEVGVSGCIILADLIRPNCLNGIVQQKFAREMPCAHNMQGREIGYCLDNHFDASSVYRTVNCLLALSGMDEPSPRI